MDHGTDGDSEEDEVVSKEAGFALRCLVSSESQLRRLQMEMVEVTKKVQRAYEEVELARSHVEYHDAVAASRGVRSGRPRSRRENRFLGDSQQGEVSGEPQAFSHGFSNRPLARRRALSADLRAQTLSTTSGGS